MEQKNMYFIAIIPPAAICDEITSFKTDMATRFNSRKALKTIPHITLKAPFSLPAGQHAHTLLWFNTLQITTAAFEAELNNFASFSNKENPVIYVEPVLTAALRHLQKEVMEHYRLAYPHIAVADTELAFTPHITIACRDLLPAAFREAWEIYKSKKYQASFEVGSFHLMQHDGSSWHIVATHTLNN